MINSVRKFKFVFCNDINTFTRISLLSLLLFFSINVNAQLNDFDLQVTKTDESCLGNGSLTFNVSYLNALAILQFSVYKYPDLENALTVTSDNFLGNLTAGDYKVIAVQMISDSNITKEQDITINSTIVGLTFAVTTSSQNCSEQGNIIVTPITGNPVLYEIFSGPVTRSPQSENVFDMLLEGIYSIRVFDQCGEGVVSTYTLLLNDSILTISDTSYPDILTACSAINITNTISTSAGSSISYPLLVEYTIYSSSNPAGSVFSQIIETGNPNQLDLLQQLPLYAQEYNYTIRVTDNCGNIFLKENLVLNPFPIVESSLIPIPCAENYIKLNVSKFKPPYTIAFLSAPGSNFNPADFNEAHPGPFTNPTINYGDEGGNPMPPGEYVIEITDACGKKDTTTITIETILPEPNVSGNNNGCYSDLGSIQASIPYRIIMSAILIPASPLGSPAQDVSEFIADGILHLSDLPVGTYTLILTDECGRVYEEIVEIPEFTDKGIIVDSKPDCTIYYSSVKVESGNGKITNVWITEAPAGFSELLNQALPYDISYNLTSTGILYISNLPAGNYVFRTIDLCGIETFTPAVLTGYTPLNETYTYVKNCGSFDIMLFDQEIQASSQLYWLQKYNPNTGQWVHPVTGNVYTEGSVPDNFNSQSIINSQTLHNLTYTGEFRIVKSFKSYGNGVRNKNCLDVLGSFDFTDGLKLQNAYKIACSQNPDDVYLQADGVAPYSFKIVEKDGEEYLFDNGTNNIFTGLEPGTYKFIVEDACGSMAPLTVNISTLPSLAAAHQPSDMYACTDTVNLTGYNFDLTQQNSQILGGQNPDIYTITYYLNAADAENATNAIDTDFVNTSNPQTIYARVEHNSISICHGNTSFELVVNNIPELDVQEQVYICDESTVTLNAWGNHDEYVWSTGQTTSSITVSEPGEYTVKARNYYGDNSYCESVPVHIVVEPSFKPEIISVDTEDWTEDKNSITVNVSGNNEYKYSLDNINYQQSNVFDGLVTGVYMVYVKDKSGCGIVNKEVVLLNYPKFFTPNGDDSHDKWRIKYSANEPHMTVDIFDRYGKLIIVLDAMSEGWDGTLNGAKLPSTDYWFVAKREDGRIFKGHFAMKR